MSTYFCERSPSTALNTVNVPVSIYRNLLLRTSLPPLWRVTKTAILHPGERLNHQECVSGGVAIITTERDHCHMGRAKRAPSSSVFTTSERGAGVPANSDNQTSAPSEREAQGASDSERPVANASEPHKQSEAMLAKRRRSRACKRSAQGEARSGFAYSKDERRDD